MGLFEGKKSIVAAALGVGGAFNKDKEIDRAAVYGTALGSCLGSGKNWTLEDSIMLEAVIKDIERAKNK